MKRIVIVLTAVFLGVLGVGDVYSDDASSNGKEEQMLAEKLSGIKGRPERLNLYWETINDLKKKDELARAFRVIQRALEEDFRKKEEFELQVAGGDICLELKQYDGAIEFYRAAGYNDLKSEVSRLKLAQVYEKSELYELAIQEYLGLIKRNQKSLKANYGLASLYLERGYNTKAMEYFRRALTIKPDPDIYRKMSECAARSGDLELALVMLKSIMPEKYSYDDFINLGRLAEKLGKKEEAENYFSQAIKTSPEKADGYVDLALFYIEEGRFVPAEKILQICLDKTPDEGALHFLMGHIYYFQDRKGAALAELDKAYGCAKTNMLKKYSEKFKAFVQGR
ncbi:MAG: tetratricopeptide repeat protein [Endomicrobiales bacterium]|nr:tetratricopeptide repeat protein [Endomicrobiales bacterium]